jgi:amino acid transporter
MNSNLFTLKYWFGMNAGSLAPIVQRALVVFLVLLLALAVYSKLRKRDKGVYFRIWKKLDSFGVTNLIIGLFLLFFTYEGVIFLSMRFWFLLWLASMIVFLYFVYKEFKKIPEFREKRKQEEEFKKYIP